MRRALCVAALAIGVSLAGSEAVAQSRSATWQSTPASVLKSALRNLVAAQDKYRATHGTFASSPDVLRLKTISDVRVQILAAGESRWRAKAYHRARRGRSCVVFVGKMTAVEAPRTDRDHEMAGEERVPLCDRME